MTLFFNQVIFKMKNIMGLKNVFLIGNGENFHSKY